VRLKFNLREGLHLENRVEKRDWLSDGWSLPSRTPYYSSAGVFVDSTSSLGLATAGACIRLVSQITGEMPLKVYEGERPEVEEARDSWQWFRLKERPNEEQSAFDFWQDAAMSVESTGNAFIWKAIARRPVQDEGDIELFILNPANVFLKRDPDTNRKYYEVRRGNGKMERVPASQILQIRGWTTTAGADLGVSAIALHRETLGAALAARQFQTSFYTSGGNIPGIISVPDNPTQEALDRFQLELEQRHAGTSRPLVLTRGASWQTTGISMRDAEYIEQQKFSSEEVCRIFGVNPRMVGVLLDTQKSWDEDRDNFLQIDMAPRLRRIEMALKRDTDLFPSASELFPEFLTAAVLKPSMTTRYAAYKNARQGGWTTANEIRANENLPAIEGGDELQQTPVGGAPNEPSVTEAGT
jgi:HK97 family phage portal protein